MTKLEELRESVEDTLRTSSAAYDVWLEASFENLEIDTYTELAAYHASKRLHDIAYATYRKELNK